MNFGKGVFYIAFVIIILVITQWLFFSQKDTCDMRIMPICDGIVSCKNGVWNCKCKGRDCDPTIKPECLDPICVGGVWQCGSMPRPKRCSGLKPIDCYGRLVCDNGTWVCTKPGDSRKMTINTDYNSMYGGTESSGMGGYQIGGSPNPNSALILVRDNDLSSGEQLALGFTYSETLKSRSTLYYTLFSWDSDANPNPTVNLDVFFDNLIIPTGASGSDKASIILTMITNNQTIMSTPIFTGTLDSLNSLCNTSQNIISSNAPVPLFGNSWDIGPAYNGSGIYNFAFGIAFYYGGTTVPILQNMYIGGITSSFP